MDALLPNGPHPAQSQQFQSMLRGRFSRSCVALTRPFPGKQKKKEFRSFTWSCVITDSFIVHIPAWVSLIYSDWIRPIDARCNDAYVWIPKTIIISFKLYIFNNLLCWGCSVDLRCTFEGNSRRCWFNGYACAATFGIECKEKKVTFAGSDIESVAQFHLLDAITF